MSKYHRSSKYQRATTFRDLNDPKPMFGGIEVRKTPTFESRGFHFFLAEGGILHKIKAMKFRPGQNDWQITLTIDGRMGVRELKPYELIYTCEKDVSGHRLDACRTGNFARVENDTHQGDERQSAA